MMNISTMALAVSGVLIIVLPASIDCATTQTMEVSTVNVTTTQPPCPFTKEEIESMIKEIENSKLDHLLKRRAVSRLRRASQPDSSHWCCNKVDPGQTGPKRTVIKAKVVHKTASIRNSIKCGFLGLKRCGSTTPRVYTVTEYYTDYEYPTIPAPEFTNGCPDDHIVCCKGHVYYSVLDNCLTFIELEQILEVVNSNKDTLDVLTTFMLG